MKKQIYFAPETIEIICNLERVIMSGSMEVAIDDEIIDEDIDAQAKDGDNEFWDDLN
ncbi:MAG: hypothetical protein KBS94_07690 [Prevotella sp.]|nr:hypothetical protein [Candidatus Equicola faecalis]